jgi:hypothetical protein
VASGPKLVFDHRATPVPEMMDYCTSQERYYVVSVYWENYMKYADMLCGQNTELWYIKASGMYRVVVVSK